MAPLSNKPPTVADLILSAERRLKRARVFFGHGTDNARDEAAALVSHVLKIPHDAPAKAWSRRPLATERSPI
jgi:ribosomal protein L3 glutamine methyltransferase